MGVKIRTEKDEFPKMRKAAQALNGAKVNVGVLSGEHQWLAAIHEYGCKIPVTPKMRAYLHSIGVHLKKSTTEIVIPERSFLRAGFDENRDEVLKTAEKVLPDVLIGTMSEEQYLELVGMTLRDAIKDYAVDLKDPPKKPWPTRDPAKDNPLVETGAMINGIEFEIER